MPTLIVELPLPPKELHPNSSVVWRAKIGPKKNYRSLAYVSTKEAMQQHAQLDGPLEPPAHGGTFTVTLIYTYSINRMRDGDNLVAWAKNGLDGIAEAMGINDYRFRYEPVEIVIGKEKHLHVKVEW